MGKFDEGLLGEVCVTGSCLMGEETGRLVWFKEFFRGRSGLGRSGRVW
jgi:hypothetical protein